MNGAQQSNPWGLTPRQVQSLDAVIEAGDGQGAAALLGVGYATVQAHLTLARERMACERGLKCVILWDRWRQLNGGSALAVVPIAKEPTMGDLVAAIVVKAGAAGFSFSEIQQRDPALNVDAGVTQAMRRGLIHRAGAKRRHYRYFAKAEDAQSAELAAREPPWAPLVRLLKTVGPMGMNRADIVAMRIACKSTTQTWMQRAVASGDVFVTGPEKHYRYFGCAEWAQAAERAVARAAVTTPAPQHHPPPKGAALIARGDLHGPASSAAPAALHPRFKHTVVPTVEDTRFTVGGGFQGGEFSAEWRRRRAGG